MPHDVFISYSTKDKNAADAVCAILERNKIRCWIAPRDIIPGTGWGSSIINAIQSSRVMILVFSGNANKSPQIEREVERAISKGIPVIPLRIEDVQPSDSLEYFISSAHWLDAFTQPFEKHLERLATVVRQILEASKHPSLQDRPAAAANMQAAAPSAASRSIQQVDSNAEASSPPIRHRVRWISIFAVIVLGCLGGLGAFLLRSSDRQPVEKMSNLQPKGIEHTPAPKESDPKPGAEGGFPVHIDNNWLFANQSLPECLARGRTMADGFPQRKVGGDTIFASSNGFTFLIRCTSEKIVFFLVVGPATFSREQNNLASKRLNELMDKW